MKDRRIWKPDETCLPFYLNTCDTGNANRNRALSFTVPLGSVAVITSGGWQHSLDAFDTGEAVGFIAAGLLGSTASASIAFGSANCLRLSSNALRNRGFGLAGGVAAGSLFLNIRCGLFKMRTVLPGGTYTVGTRNSGVDEAIIVLIGYTFPT